MEPSEKLERMSVMIARSEEKVLALTVKVDTLIDEMRRDMLVMRREFVTRSEFGPIKNLVFGAVGIILVAVITATVQLSVK